MSKAVIILGAGASADFGVPILSMLFKERHARQYLEEHLKLNDLLNEVFWAPRGTSIDSCEDSLNVEQMLTILHDWQREKAVPDHLKPPDIISFRKGLLVLIQKAIFEDKDTRGKYLNPLIKIARKNFEHTTWVSFNWDCIFESSFWYSQPLGPRVNPTLAIDIENWRGSSRHHTYLKLHGGINWWLINDKITYFQWTSGGELQRKWREFDTTESYEDRPVILEPSFYKYTTSEYRQIQPQWEVFFQKLLEADCVILVGYSLPEMDVNARSTILTAFQVNKDCRWLVIDPSEHICSIYHKLLGTERTEILQIPLVGFNADIKHHLVNAFPSISFADD